MARKEMVKQATAAKYLGVKPHTLENWRHLGRGPRFYKVGGQVRYDQADLDAFLEANVHEPIARQEQTA